MQPWARVQGARKPRAIVARTALGAAPLRSGDYTPKLTAWSNEFGALGWGGVAPQALDEWEARAKATQWLNHAGLEERGYTGEGDPSQRSCLPQRKHSRPLPPTRQSQCSQLAALSPCRRACAPCVRHSPPSTADVETGTDRSRAEKNRAEQCRRRRCRPSAERGRLLFMSLRCSCNAIAMPLPHSCHVAAMLLPYRCHLVTRSLLCRSHVAAVWLREPQLRRGPRGHFADGKGCFWWTSSA